LTRPPDAGPAGRDAAIFILVVLAFVTLSGALLRLFRVPLPVQQIAIAAALAWPARGLHVKVDPELKRSLKGREPRE